MKNPKLCLRHEQIKIRLLLKIHEQYFTADSGIDVTGLDATWTHNIATKEKFEGNKNGTNAWGKYGILKVTMNAKGFFFFKFLSLQGAKSVLQDGSWMIRGIPIFLNKWLPSVSLTKEDTSKYSTADSGIDVTGLDATWTHNIATKETFEGNKNGTGAKSVLQDGSGMIRGIPIFLNKWLPSVSLTKEDTSKVLVWIKMHDVPLAAYTSDGLSMIVTKLCKPMMLDSIPILSEKVVEQNVDQDGFRVVKRGTKGNNNRSFGKTQSRFEYQPKLNRSNNDGASTSTNTNATKKNDGTFMVNITTSNPYTALGAEYEHNKDNGNRDGFREGISLMNRGTRRRMIK
ncbi:hypothetical protein Tco_1438598 [Tanacetum coccineum]